MRATSYPKLIKSYNYWARTAVVATAAVTLVGTTSTSSYAASTTRGSSATSRTLNIIIHDNAPTNKGVEVVDAAFEAQHPGLKVNLSIIPDSSYAEVMSTRIAAKDADIVEDPGAIVPNPSYVTGPEPTFVQGVMAGDWTNLAGQAFLKQFDPSIVKELSYKGGVYAVPTGLDYYTGVFYNKAIFAKYHLAVPVTWSQFLHVCQVLKSAGVSPMIVGGKDTWPAGLIMLGVVQSLYTTQQMQTLNEGLWTGRKLLTTPKSIEVLQRVQTIFSYVSPSFPGVAYAEAPSLFAAGQAAMTPDGTWDEPTIQQANPKLSFGYFPLPTGSTASSNAYLGGKLEIAYAIPSSSKNKALAEEWLALYSSRSYYKRYITDSGFIPAEPGMSTTKFNNSLRPYEAPGGFRPAWDQVFIENSRSGTLSTYPWAYPDIAPMGSYTNMTSLADAIQTNWTQSLGAAKS